MKYVDHLIKLAGVAIFLWCAYWLFLDITTWGKDIGSAMVAAPQNVIGLVLGPAVFIVSGPLSRWVSIVFDKLGISSKLGWFKEKAQSAIPESWGETAGENPGDRPGAPASTSEKQPMERSVGPATPGSGWTPGQRRRKLPGRRFRIPGLRSFKRLVAFFLMVVDFIIGELALTGPAGNQPLAIFFLLNSFILADYLWKTRKQPTGGGGP